MLKVLIVDDDKLTRKGLIASMPWADYAMEVVGEASNGIEALRFLEEHTADLVLCDLDMPLMSGLELIRKATVLYPDLAFAVLTIHSDFECIQQALRLGAIDYVAKVQLDRENFSSLLERISNRLRKNVQERSSQAGHWEDCVCHEDTISLLIALSEEDAEGPARGEKEYISTGRGVWFLNQGSAEPESVKRYLEGRFLLLEIQHVLGMKYGEVFRCADRYRRRALFYEYRREDKHISHSVKELEKREESVSPEQFTALKQHWLSMEWLHDETAFQSALQELSQSRLTKEQLLHIVLAVEHAWNRSYSEPLELEIVAPSDFLCWQEIEDWLEDIRQKSALLSGKYRFSREVTESIFRARRMIEEEYAQHLYSDEIARRVNMSRSYFSQCFHEICGCSFVDYLRRVRVEKAKEYLSRTSLSLQQIAEQTGYDDEKYFNRVFRKSTGMLPSEYRKQHRI